MHFNMDLECLGLVVVWVGKIFIFCTAFEKMELTASALVQYCCLIIMHWWLFWHNFCQGTHYHTHRVEAASLCSANGETTPLAVTHLTADAC